MSAPSPGKIHIRRMRLDDVKAVCEIDALSFPVPWPRYAYRHELTVNRVAHLWVAEMEDGPDRFQVVGMIAIWLVADEVHVATLAVHPDYRRRGIARRLLAEALRFGVQQGARMATLEVRAGNLAAQGLYRQFGFEVVGRRRAYYRDNAEDALLMTLSDLRLARLDQATAEPERLPVRYGSGAPPERV